MASTTIDSITQIPVIDFQPFLSGDRLAKQAVADLIYQACHEVGFLLLRNHGVPADLLDRLFQASQQFFDLPLATKQQALRNHQTNCGYVPITGESLNPSRPGDLKEAFNVGEQAIWPPGQDTFCQTVWSFYQFCTQKTAYQILRAFALGLHLPESFFEEKHGKHFFLRLLHYPPQAHPIQPAQIGAGEHTDYGSLTLLFQDQVGGLEIYTRDGCWISVPHLPGTIVVNVGDAMQRWTNDRLRSTPHRVIRSVGELALRSRYSVALFCDPNPEVEIACLVSCLDPGFSALYPPILAGDYLRSRLDATY